MVLDAWRELHRSRFPELQFDCGNEATPGIIDSPDLRDWSRRETTPDQNRIESYIDRFDLRDKRILHIGIGNSGLAKRLHRRAREIVGTSIDEPEILAARGLSLGNYIAVEHNKYSGLQDVASGKFDFIVDNNLTSPCCCIRHLAELFRFLHAKLADGGQIVTDAQGLAWIPRGSNPRWSFDFDDLTAVANAAGLSAYHANRTVYVLARETPPKPRFLPVLRHKLRRAKSAPGKLLHLGKRAAAAAYRSSQRDSD